MESKNTQKRVSKNSFLLIMLCFAVYYIAYLGRYSYSSNVNCVMDFFGVNKASAGMVGTFFFIAYGVGQVVNGLLCKKYNPRYAIGIALFVSAVTNIVFAFAGKNSFALLKYFWLINGFAQSVLWSSIIRLLNLNLPKNSLSVAIFVMALPVSLGTFTIYGLSSLFSALNLTFKSIFFLSAVLLFVTGTVWFFSVDILKNKCLAERGETCEEKEEQGAKRGSLGRGFVFTFCMLALFAIANNFVKDGLTTWMPAVLKERYGLSNSLSTFLTVFLPLFAVFGSTLAIYLNKILNNYVLSCGFLYSVAFILFIGVILTVNYPIWIIPLACFIMVACAMSGVNNVITNIFPMLYSNKINAGAVAGVLDGFCYVGSAITAYGMGAIADTQGWNTVFWIFLAVCFLMIVLSGIYLLVTRKKRVDK